MPSTRFDFLSSFFYLSLCLWGASCGPGIPLTPNNAMSDSDVVTPEVARPHPRSIGVVDNQSLFLKSGTISYLMIFEETANVRPRASDFSLDILSGIPSASISSITSTDTDCIITLNVAGGDGEVAIIYDAGDQSFEFMEHKITVDNTAPAKPTTVTAPTTALLTSLTISFTASTEPNVDFYHVKLCSNRTCDSNCNTAVDVIEIEPTLTSGLVAGRFYVCVETVDKVEQVSGYKSSTNQVTIST